ncbi:hypothetical protein PCH_Pc13g01840 [Penicillium rubens Wisconsin 54-1255]|uniref:Uncharacterized protein n=1 Tax=Penicillium rubens (strain ATCC 28089 / DSM 1075 / NRRL 1951 / Wisconsin 54-1255) TaxID=500485 RepID=B6H1U4_PENRW|nr:hypothetical protein PCH_Pc13g01840 [Penicillium rubens Wisconsin 54-1255]
MLNGAACASPDHDESIGKSANAERVNAVLPVILLFCVKVSYVLAQEWPTIHSNAIIALDHSHSFQPDCASRIHNPPIPSVVLLPLFPDSHANPARTGLGWIHNWTLAA